MRRAGLISMEQIQEALQVQAESRHLRFGELLVARGWLKPETVDFFAEKLPQVAMENHKYPLGYYLKSAGLLDDEQINAILEEQEQAGLRFGELTVRKGWVKQETINLLLNYTAIGAKSLSMVA
ncbi:MAG: hypothetical protein HC925_07520 [Coleofasciculaceae cyanobacterium SM2_3_26]|nr:hypothetical protein [Coleofasciculaceae cyanobacterium SM2_3_26]